MCFVYERACLGLVVCYGRPSIDWTVVKLLSEFTSSWRSRLPNTGVEQVSDITKTVLLTADIGTKSNGSVDT